MKRESTSRKRHQKEGLTLHLHKIDAHSGVGHAMVGARLYKIFTWFGTKNALYSHGKRIKIPQLGDLIFYTKSKDSCASRSNLYLLPSIFNASFCETCPKKAWIIYAFWS